MNRSQQQQKNKKGPQLPKKNVAARNAQREYAKSTTTKSGSIPAAFVKVGSNNRNRVARESGRELIGEILGSTAWTVNTFSLNPGLYSTAPVLSQIAQRYESYIFNSLRVEFETSIGTTSAGDITLAIDYDAADSAPTDLTQAMSYQNSKTGPSYTPSLVHNSVSSNLKKRKTYYVRNGDLAANLDIKTYDTGTLYVCTQGQAATSKIGNVYLAYDVSLSTLQVVSSTAGSSLYGNFSGSSNAAPFATKTGNLPATVVSSGTTTSVNTWTFTQPWEGQLTMNMTGTGFAGNDFTTSGTAALNSGVRAIENAAATGALAYFNVRAYRGQTVIITIDNTTISASVATFRQGVAP